MAPLSWTSGWRLMAVLGGWATAVGFWGEALPAMTEYHPSTSAIGSHLDEQTEIIALAQRYYEEEGRPKGRALDHWLRAEREVHRLHSPSFSEPLPQNESPSTEEAM